MRDAPVGLRRLPSECPGVGVAAKRKAGGGKRRAAVTPPAERGAATRIGTRRSLAQFGLLAASFVAVTLVAWLAGAGLGLAATFGQIAFAGVLVYILARG